MRKLLLVLAALAMAAPVSALDITANAGLMSEYIFRGLPQSNGKASAWAGADLEHAGFYAGTWAAKVDSPTIGADDGLEVDLYGGYSGEVGDFTFLIGGTAYLYTNDFDDEYYELNLSGGWKFINVEAAIGRYDNFDGPTNDYQFYKFNLEYSGFFAGVGTFQDDFRGEYYEAGYAETLTIQEQEIFDYSITYTHSTKTLLGDKSDNFLIFTIGKNFTLFSN